MTSQRNRDGASSTATLGYEAQLWRMADAMTAIERDNPALQRLQVGRRVPPRRQALEIRCATDGQRQLRVGEI